MLLYTPFTGLGLYGGFRGNRWLKNRIKIFKQFVIPSLQNQTDREFVHWISWREEEKKNPYVLELGKYLESINHPYVFTFHGLCIWDDKYPDELARERMFQALHGSLPELLDAVPDCDEIHWLLVPSDDLYDRMTVESIKKAFKDKETEAVTYTKGYICNYHTKEILEYNPTTNPPFSAIKFPRKTFFDPGKHMNYIALKKDVNQYKAGTPQPSHEYLPDCLKTAYFEGRGFLVGCHGENISTHFNHPFGGHRLSSEEAEICLLNFGILSTPKLTLPVSVRKAIIRRLPYRWQKRFRYIMGEKLYKWFYNFIRS